MYWLLVGLWPLILVAAVLLSGYVAYWTWRHRDWAVSVVRRYVDARHRERLAAARHSASLRRDKRILRHERRGRHARRRQMRLEAKRRLASFPAGAW